MELTQKDIEDGYKASRSIAVTKTLVNAYMSDQDRASIQEALESSTIEISEATVVRNWTKEVVQVTRPLIRVYVPLLVTEVRFTANTQIQITVDRSITTAEIDPNTKRRVKKENEVPAFIQNNDNKTRLSYIWSVLRNLKRDELQELFNSESKIMEVRSVVLLISKRIEETHQYELPIIIEKGLIATLAKVCGIGIDELYRRIRAKEV